MRAHCLTETLSGLTTSSQAYSEKSVGFRFSYSQLQQSTMRGWQNSPSSLPWFNEIDSSFLKRSRKKFSLVVLSCPMAMYFTFLLDLSSTMNMCSPGCTCPGTCKSLSRVALLTRKYARFNSFSSSSSWKLASALSYDLLLTMPMIFSNVFLSLRRLNRSCSSLVSPWSFLRGQNSAALFSSFLSILQTILAMISRNSSMLNRVQGTILTNLGSSRLECRYFWTLGWAWLLLLQAYTRNPPILISFMSLFSKECFSILTFHSMPSFRSVLAGDSSKAIEYSRQCSGSFTATLLGRSRLRLLSSTLRVLILYLFLLYFMMQSSLSYLTSPICSCWTQSPPTRQILSSCKNIVLRARNFSCFSSKL